MGVCFGSNPIDRRIEGQLFEWLDEIEDDAFECENCGHTCTLLSCYFSELGERDIVYCPRCHDAYEM
jgi:transcription elongation factor Elf1